MFLFTIVFVWTRTEYIMDMIRDWRKEWRNKKRAEELEIRMSKIK
jgi:hypothetical protein